MDMKEKAEVAILILDKIDFKIEAIKRDKKGHCLMLKGIIYQEDITLVNIYTPNTGAPKNMRKIFENFKKDIDSNTLILRVFNTIRSKMDISSKQNKNKETVALNNALDQMDLTNIDRTFHPKEANYIFFKCT